jgi:hypothetical protein
MAEGTGPFKPRITYTEDIVGVRSRQNPDFEPSYLFSVVVKDGWTVHEHQSVRWLNRSVREIERSIREGFDEYSPFKVPYKLSMEEELTRRGKYQAEIDALHEKRLRRMGASKEQRIVAMTSMERPIEPGTPKANGSEDFLFDG